MKKVSVVLFALFLSIALIGCNNGEKALDFIATPTGLEVTNTVLSWDEVDGAKGYIVYANDEEVEDTKDLEYDFRDLEEDEIIFRVRAKGGLGVEDSGLSASVAYFENREEALQALKAMGESTGMVAGDEIYEEFIRKGLTAEELEDIYEAAMYITEGQGTGSLSDQLSELQDLLDEVDNLEAFVSGSVMEISSFAFEEELDVLYNYVEEYEDFNSDDLGEDELANIEEMMAGIENQIDLLEGILDELENNPDAIVLAACNGIEYMMNMVTLMSTDMVETLEDMMTSDSPGDMTASELQLVVEEMTSLLEDTMPSQEDFMVIFTVFESFMSLSADVYENDDSIENLSSKLAVQARYTIQAFINLFDTFDEAFFEAFLDAAALENYTHGQHDLVVLMVEYLDKYYDDNQKLFDNMENVFTEEEKEILYNQSSKLQSLNFFFNYGMSYYTRQLYSYSFQSLAFSDVYALNQLGKETFDVLLDELADNPAVIETFFISTNFQYWDSTNDYLEVTYEDSDEMGWARSYYNTLLIDQIMDLVAECNDEMNEDEFKALLSYMTDYVSSMLFMSIRSYDSAFGTETIFDLTDAIVTDNYEAIYELYIDLVDYFVKENTFGDIADVLEDYLDSNQGDDSTFILDGMLLMAVGDFLSENRQEAIDGIVENVLQAVMDSDLNDSAELTNTMKAAIEGAVSAMIDHLATASDELKDIDYTDLSESDIEDLMTFLEEFSTEFESLAEVLG